MLSCSARLSEKEVQAEQTAQQSDSDSEDEDEAKKTAAPQKKKYESEIRSTA